MLEIHVPGFAELKLQHAVFDYNGTLAVDGLLIKDVAVQLNSLSKQLQIHIITGDTFATVKKEVAGINCQLTILPPENQAQAKVNYLRQLNSQEVVAFGNGRNDQLMLKEAAVGIAILGDEGAAAETMMAADIVVSNIFTAVNLIQYPRRLVASLRF